MYFFQIVHIELSFNNACCIITKLINFVVICTNYPADKSCKPDQFKCEDGTCIDGGLKCDGVLQCPDSTDEVGCGMLQPI